MKRIIKILLLITVLGAFMPVKGQQPAFQSVDKISAPRLTATKSSENKFQYALLTSAQAPQRAYLYISPHTIPADNYTRNFGFFCKEELQLQKRSGVNFSLRLGTLDQCNMLEGKTRTIPVR